jgi:curli production assembly/transport component CsgG
MIAKQYWLFLLVILGVFHLNITAQNVSNSSETKKTEFYELRGSNAIDFGAGTSVINGDLSDPKFEIYFHVGYKRYIIPHLNVNISYNKFNLAYVDVYNEGFMSFDLNLESTLLPHNKFSPFVYGGGGYNASNYFKQTAIKLQGGGGFEYIMTEGIGLKLYGDYNYVLSDELDGLIAGNSDDTYFRIGLGINYYFGGGNKKAKIDKDEPSIINSNQIFNSN